MSLVLGFWVRFLIGKGKHREKPSIFQLNFPVNHAEKKTRDIITDIKFIILTSMELALTFSI